MHSGHPSHGFALTDALHHAVLTRRAARWRKVRAEPSEISPVPGPFGGGGLGGRQYRR